MAEAATESVPQTIKEEPEKETAATEVPEGATNGDAPAPGTEEKKEEVIEECPADKKEESKTDSPSKQTKKKKNPISWLKKNISFRKDRKPKEANGVAKTEEKKEDANEETAEKDVETKENEEKPAEEPTTKSEEPIVNGDHEAPKETVTEEAAPVATEVAAS